jgi:23S rRNA pseudouridine1911/1915/1917 synthase
VSDLRVLGGELIRLVASAAESRQRLDKVLGGKLGSRAQAQALLRAGLVRVGGLARKASYIVRAGDVVEAVRDLAVSAGPGAAPAPEALPLEVLYEDRDLLLVNKAPGMVVHPAPGHPRGTLVNALVHHLGTRPAGGAIARPGIVHRLDRDTSGVLLVAKTLGAHESLALQFRQRTVRKEYVAVVRGRMPAREGLIDRPIGRHPRERKRMSVRTHRGRAALTRYVVHRDYGVASVVRLHPHTGRTHQLRVHLAAVGHPVVGDRVYGGSGGRGRGARAAMLEALAQFPRQALHAARLEFVHPGTGETLRVEAPLPADMRELVALLGRHADGGAPRMSETA